MLPILGLMLAAYAIVRFLQIPIEASVAGDTAFPIPKEWRVALLLLLSLAGSAVMVVLALALWYAGAR